MVNDPTVNDLKQIRYTQDGVISYKLEYTQEEFSQLPGMKRLEAPTDPVYPPLRTKPRPLSPIRNISIFRNKK